MRQVLSLLMLDLVWKSSISFVSLMSLGFVGDIEYRTTTKKTKLRTLLSLALLKNRHYLAEYKLILALVGYGTSTSIIELYKFKIIGA